MKASPIKRLLSFLVPLVVERKDSDLNPGLEIALQGGRYVLNSEDVNYSFGALHRVFRKAFDAKNIRSRNIESVLVLGFGSGSVASILRTEYKKELKITGVEADEKVIEFGKKYFADVYADPSLQIEQTTAESFAETSEEKFDLIVVDVFVNTDVPDSCRSKEFLTRLSKRLSPGGILFYNYILTTEKAYEFSKLEKYFREVFPETQLLKLSIDGAMNRVLIAE